MRFRGAHCCCTGAVGGTAVSLPALAMVGRRMVKRRGSMLPSDGMQWARLANSISIR